VQRVHDLAEDVELKLRTTVGVSAPTGMQSINVTAPVSVS